jgi:hypothetical protein
VVRSDSEGAGTEELGPSSGRLADVLDEIRVLKEFPSHIPPVTVLNGAAIADSRSLEATLGIEGTNERPAQ